MKVKDIIKNRKRALPILIFAGELAAGFVFSEASMVGTSAFADISIAGAAGLTGTAAVFMGSLFRCFMDGTTGKNIVKLAAMVMILIAKLLMDNRRSPLYCGVYTSICVFLSGTAVSAVIGELPYKLIFYIFYGAAAGFTSYSICRIISDVKKGAAADLTSSGSCFYAVVYTIYTASLCSAELPFMNVGAALGVAVTMLAAFYYGSTGGVVCGALTACAAFLSSSRTGMTVVLLPAAGLFSGYLRQRKIPLGAVLFISASLMLTVLTGMTKDIIYCLTNYITGAGIFMIAAPYYSDRCIRVSGMEISAADVVSTRLSFLSDSVEFLKRETTKLPDSFAIINSAGNEISDHTEMVCSKCYRKHICRRQGSSTLKALSELSGMSEISMENFPAELDTCIRRNELIAARQKDINSETLDKLMEMRMSDCRSVLLEQLSISEEMVRSAARKNNIFYSAPVSMTIKNKLMKFGFIPSYVNACYNANGRLIVEMYFPADEEIPSVTRVCDLVSDELKMKLCCTDPVNSGKEIRIRLFERPAMNLEVCTASQKGSETGESGDNFLIFGDGTGTGYVVLSDGMGSGREAAFESGLAAGLFRRLISSGMEQVTAVRMINSIMFSKSKDESFATLDIMRIDLDMCEMTSVKSGAAATLVKHGNNVIKISASTFPVGMYETSDVFSAAYSFEEGDIAIMFSDGICEGEYRFIKELLLSGDDLKSIVDEICEKSVKFSPFKRSDDVTVIGVRAVSA